MNDELKVALEKFKINVDKGIETYGELYEEALRKFLNSYDFMKLGQAVNGKRWESAAMCIRRMSMEADKLGVDCFQRQFMGLRQNIARKEEVETKNILSLVVTKRIQIQDVLKRY